jgi:hypothetical protein
MLCTLRCPATPVIYPVNSSKGFPSLPSECAEYANPSRITWLHPLTPYRYCLAFSVSSI